MLRKIATVHPFVFKEKIHNFASAEVVAKIILLIPFTLQDKKPLIT